MKFFNNCKTLDEVKATYKTLAKQFHPDKGGDLETMQAINNEYSFICAKLAKGENLTAEETEAAILDAEKYREALEKIITLEGINIELVGAWIWVTGNTYPVKNTLKEAGFFFASKKIAWYFRSEEYKVCSRGRKMDLEEIRTKYGSQRIETRHDNKRLFA
jgi:hypothetical protein